MLLEVIYRCCTITALLLALMVSYAYPHDAGQWTDSDLRGWYQSLMQPDNPRVSCCGEADAYYCDDVFVKDSKTYCKITDDRPDEPRNRPHRAIGTIFEIPVAKLKWDRSNPTGHAILFVGKNDFVLCFVQGTGI